MIQPLLAAALLLAQQPGLTAKPCITKAEASDLAIFLMPSIIQGAAQKCRSSLPQDAYVTRAAQPLSARLRREGGNRWGSVKGTIARVTGTEFPAILGEVTAMRMAEAAGAGTILKELEVKDCPRLDEALEALSPLPVESFGKLFALALEEAGKDEASQIPFTICPARPA